MIKIFMPTEGDAYKDYFLIAYFIFNKIAVLCTVCPLKVK